MGQYSEDALWADIDPIAQDEGPNPLAAIAYPAEYSEAMSYLRAVMAKNELSERALALTEDIIDMNPAHYTVWLYRAKIIFELGLPLRDEVRWLNDTSLQNLKNYQIWHHRQMLIDRMDSSEGEIDFIITMLEKDAKNYHVWSYRQWLVQRFGLWDAGEIESVEKLLEQDVRNNSAWNHRFFVVFGKDDKEAAKDEKIRNRELEFAKAGINKAPQNQSPWNYIRGILRAANLPASTLKDFAEEFASLDKPEDVHSSHALDLLADAYAEEASKKEQAAEALDLLAKKYDPIRANYWNFRKSQLQLPSASA